MHVQIILQLTLKSQQAHYWESYTTNNKDDLAIDDDVEMWQERVLNTITGEGTTGEFLGDHIDWGLFNQPGDNTKLYFMTPLRPDSNKMVSSDLADAKYKNKLQLIIDLVQAQVDLKGVLLKVYKRLNYHYDRETDTDVGPDANQINMNERGICLFQ